MLWMLFRFNLHFQCILCKQNTIAQASLYRNRIRRLVLHGSLYAHLVPLLDGSLTQDDIISQLDEQHHLVDVVVAIEQMKQAGYLIEANENQKATPKWAWDQLNCGVEFLKHSLQTSKLGLVVVGQANPNALIYALKDYSFNRDESFKNMDLVIVLTDD